MLKSASVALIDWAWVAPEDEALAELLAAVLPAAEAVDVVALASDPLLLQALSAPRPRARTATPRISRGTARFRGVIRAGTGTPRGGRAGYTPTTRPRPDRF